MVAYSSEVVALTLLPQAQPITVHFLPFWASSLHPQQYKSFVDGKDSVLQGDFINPPGQKVGVDQLILAEPGLVPQDKGNMTCAQIWAATVFVDYFTKFVHMVLMTNQTAKSALKAKFAFEHLAGKQDVTIFTDSLFQEDFMNGLQRLSFCAVGSHHQNGIVERAIH